MTDFESQDTITNSETMNRSVDDTTLPIINADSIEVNGSVVVASDDKSKRKRNIIILIIIGAVLIVALVGLYIYNNLLFGKDKLVYDFVMSNASDFYYPSSLQITGGSISVDSEYAIISINADTSSGGKNIEVYEIDRNEVLSISDLVDDLLSELKDINILHDEVFNYGYMLPKEEVTKKMRENTKRFKDYDVRVQELYNYYDIVYDTYIGVENRKERAINREALLVNFESELTLKAKQKDDFNIKKVNKALKRALKD